MLIEFSTGAYTCSVNAAMHEDEGCLVTLTHHMEVKNRRIRSRLDNIIYFQGRGILLIRNPFDAILSAFRHKKFGTHSSSELALRTNILRSLNLQNNVNNGINVKEFEKVAKEYIIIWREIVEQWVELGEVLVVHYEDVVDDKVAEVERILKFLEFIPDKKRMECMKFASLDFYKRQSQGDRRTLYSAELARVVRENIDFVNKLLLRHGHRGVPYNKYRT